MRQWVYTLCRTHRGVPDYASENESEVFMKSVIVIIAILFSYYAIGGMATTNIMRLLRGEETPQTYPHCHCASCRHIIPVYNQFPLFSYVFNGGKCRYCGAAIPFLTTFIEIEIGVMMSVITALCAFSPLGVVFSFLAYEGVRWIMILKYGHREQNFVREYYTALGFMFIAFCLVEFMSLLYTYCC